MKIRLLAFAVLLPLVGTAANETELTPISPREIAQGFRDGVLLAKPRATHRATSEEAERREGFRVRRRWDRFDGLRLLELPAGDSPARAIERLLASGRYEYVQRDHLLRPSAVPNDPDFASRQWSHANSGADNGIAGADIGSTRAWDLRTDAPEVVVAVIDSGVRFDHPDLAANMWTNSREIPGNGRDDDGNGYVDDVYGINAILNNGNPADDDGHGTHVAGIIGAVGNNGVGIAGVAWRVRLMALKFIRPASGSTPASGLTSDSIECIDYAIRHGAHIINASFGSSSPTTQFDPAQRDAIQRARAAGILFVAAAGNESHNMELLAHYPASHRLDNVVAVAASTNRDDAAIFTNYGPGTVELFAPGFDIWSTYYTNATPYTQLSGTSMAAPHVAGAFALLKAQFPQDTYRQLINRLLRHVDPISAFRGRVQTGGRLNLDRALRSTDNRPFNDDFAERSRLSGPNITARNSNVGATAEAEPAIAGQASLASLWWEWTPTSSGLVRVSTTGSSYDTLLAVYTGTSVASLVPVAANDDEPGQTTSRLEFTAQAGTTYLIVVAGKGGAQGTTLLDLGSIPANDNFAAAQGITGRTALIEAANAQATVETGEPRILGFTGGKSLWYRWVAPASGRFQFGLKSDGFDPLLAIYTGTALNALTLVAANDNADTATGSTDPVTTALVTVEATAGTTYHLQVDGRATGGTPPANAPFLLTLNDTLWQGHTGDSITSAPCVGPDGAVYVGSTDGVFHAFNADGSRRWPALKIDGMIDTSAACLAPDGTLYFGARATTAALNDGRLFAYNSATGEKKWEIVVGSGYSANSAIALGADGTLYLHAEAATAAAARLYAYVDQGSSAALKWSVAIPGSSYASPSIGPDGTIYLGSDDTATRHRFYALNPADGSVKWSLPTDNAVYTAAAIDGSGNVYYGTLSSGRLYSVTAAGATRWTYTGASVGTSSSPALSPDGTVVYFAGYDAKLHAVNTADGSGRWTFALGKEVRASSPAVDANGVIYVGCYDGLIYAVNPDGSPKRTWSTGDIVRSSPAISGTRLYFASNDQRLYATDIGAGTTGPWPQYRHNARRTGRAVAETFAIITQPRSQAAVLGLPFSLAVTATGNGNLTYQWYKDGEALPGATGAAYAIPAAAFASAGTYTVRITSSQGTLSSEPAVVSVEPLRPGRLTNVSVRTTAGTGAQTLIVGFTVSGTGTKPLLLRGIGPTLAAFGVTGAVADPQLAVFSGTESLTANDNWGGAAPVAAAAARVGAFALDPASRDAALLQSLGAGSYTLQVTGNGATGLALAEIYDTDDSLNAASRLANLSARAQVGTGGNLLIAGFTLSGNVPKQVLIRGVGPALASFGVTGTLANPRLEVYRGSALAHANDDWGGGGALSAAFTQVGAFALTNTSSRDAALLVTLTPGSYTAQISGVNNATGVALVEVYEVP
ncbi:MAG: S8 family serine peptidase [Verrucomicrobia bacterium]|nr:S8 family serine peptidase [Verrucomicrobiota bacterium]